MADISAGPDYLARVLAKIYDEEEIEPGDEPVSALERLSLLLAEERAKAMKRVTRRKKAEKLVVTITIEDLISFGSGDAARLETSVGHTVKTAKPAPIKARRSWVDEEGNQIGQEPAQTTIKGLDGGASETASLARRKAM